MCYIDSAMKSCYLLLPLLFCCAGIMSALDAREEKSTAVGAAVEAMRPVPEALSQAKWLTKKKPNLKAEYYMFLRSASWCVPCDFFVPPLLKEYSKMKSAKMELIFLGQEDEPVVKKYMADKRFKCPGVMPASLGSVPGVSFEGLGFPSMCIVDADGNFIACKGGTNMMEWRDILKEHKKQLLQAKREAKKRAAEEEE